MLRIFITIAFVAQSAFVPQAHAEAAKLRAEVAKYPCLQEYFDNSDAESVKAQEMIGARYKEEGVLDDGYCDVLRAHFDGETEGGSPDCADGNCNNPEPQTFTDETDRSGIDDDFVDEIEVAGSAEINVSSGGNKRRPRKSGGGFDFGSFFSNPAVMLMGGLALGVGGMMLFNHFNKQNQHQPGFYPPTGRFYPPRLIPARNYPLGLRPVPGMNYGGLLGGGGNNINFNNGGPGFGGPGYGGQNGGSWNSGPNFGGGGNGGWQGGGGGNMWQGDGYPSVIYNGDGGLPPNVLPYLGEA